MESAESRALTEKQKLRVLRGEVPVVYTPEQPTEGAEIKVTDQVSILVSGSKLERGKGWRWEFWIVDSRPRLLRDSPCGGYTTEPGLALRDEGEAVPAEYQDELVREGRTAAVLMENARAAESGKDKDLVTWLADTLDACERAGVDTTKVEHVTRQQVLRLRRRLDRCSAAAI